VEDVHQNCKGKRNILVHFANTLFSECQKGFQNVFRILSKTVMSQEFSVVFVFDKTSFLVLKLFLVAFGSIILLIVKYNQRVIVVKK
jgi:hypothetical protein